MKKGNCPKCESSNWVHDNFDMGICKNCGYEWDLTGFPIGSIPGKDIYDR